MAELKPCPFCGGKVRIWHNLETENYDIECQMCDCEFRKECRDEQTVLTCFVKCNIREEKLKQKAEKTEQQRKEVSRNDL